MVLSCVPCLGVSSCSGDQCIFWLFYGHYVCRKLGNCTFCVKESKRDTLDQKLNRLPHTHHWVFSGCEWWGCWIISSRLHSHTECLMWWCFGSLPAWAVSWFCAISSYFLCNLSTREMTVMVIWKFGVSSYFELKEGNRSEIVTTVWYSSSSQHKSLTICPLWVSN